MNNTDKNIAVVAVSGGLDSCVTASIAMKEYKVAFAHANYGQRTEGRELKAFIEIADHFNVRERLVIDFTHLAKIGNSSLTDRNIKVSNADLKRNAIPTSYIPFRNANILSACVSWAEVLGANSIFAGAVFEDSSGYPDCRPSFFKAFESVIEKGTKPETSIKIFTPVIHLSKSEIINKGLELQTPFHLTWSCYQNEEDACGICDSCALRLRGFQLAGIEDPISYIVKPDYLIEN